MEAAAVISEDDPGPMLLALTEVAHHSEYSPQCVGQVTACSSRAELAQLDIQFLAGLILSDSWKNLGDDLTSKLIRAVHPVLHFIRTSSHACINLQTPTWRARHYCIRCTPIAKLAWLRMTRTPHTHIEMCRQ